jgi:hypothetical protein
MGHPILEDGIEEGYPDPRAKAADRAQIAEVGDNLLRDVVPLVVNFQPTELAGTIEGQVQNAVGVVDISKPEQHTPLD